MSATRDVSGTSLDGRYRLESLLGEGGMGVVYRAYDTTLHRTVAVKVFREGMTQNARTTSETRMLARLNHPALVTLYDARVGGGDPRYLVMEYVDGPTLQSTLEAGPLSASTVRRVARDLAEALSIVHGAGIVHRDVKPANVLLRSSSVPGERFQAKLADFGIAHIVDSTRLTTPGTVIGSAAYMSPEQVTGASPDPASDIYSLGLVLLEAMTGSRAFPQGVAHEAAIARLTQDPIIPSTVGPDWALLLSEMTARNPADRPRAADVVARAADAHARVVSSTAVMTVAEAAQPVHGRLGGAPERTSRTLVSPSMHLGPSRDDAGALHSTEPFDRQHPTVATANVIPRSPLWARRMILLVVAIIAAGVVVAGVAIWSTEDSPAPRPSLPVLDAPLSEHLDQLLDSVSP